MKKKLEIGLRQARLLCQMAADERLAFIAEGLPVILASAQGFWEGSRQLSDRPREASVLKGFATEEAAKILILMDAVRCPPTILPSKLGTIVGWFYNHLARLIYADAAAWHPKHIAQLRDWVASDRKAHYVEGNFGEFIVPNQTVYRRESQLYVDIYANGDGKAHWSTPVGYALPFPSFAPRALHLTESMEALGLFTVQGLIATADVWGQVDFAEKEDREDARRLTRQLIGRLDDLGVPSDSATQTDVETLYDWQLPMYHFDFSPIHVPLDELEAQQEAIFWSELGDP
jgi:hypothetical protein